jgi:aromatic-amino-acid transaminase
MSFYETYAAISKDPIVGLVQLASKDDSPEKFTAIIGSAADDDGKLIIPEIVHETARELVKDGIDMSYAPSSGIKGLGELMANEILGIKVRKEFDDARIYQSSIVTCAGTNAISAAIMTCTSEKDKVITHNPHWAGYDSIMLALKKEPLVNFELLDASDNFNIGAFENTISETIAENPESKIIIILNTPFDNPLGKDFGDETWKDIGLVLRKFEDKEILLILDTAYLDFGPEGKDYKRMSFIPRLFQSVNNKNFNLIIAGTISKSFAMYGARVGVATLLTKNEELSSKWSDIMGGSIRGTFSNATNFSQLLVKKILETPQKLAYIHDFQATTCDLLNKRTCTFLEALRSLNIKEFRAVEPDGGFFVSLKFNDKEYAKKYYEELLANHFYAPLISDQFLRIPICGISEANLQIAAGKLSKINKEVLAKF